MERRTGGVNAGIRCAQLDARVLVEVVESGAEHRAEVLPPQSVKDVAAPGAVAEEHVRALHLAQPLVHDPHVPGPAVEVERPEEPPIEAVGRALQVRLAVELAKFEERQRDRRR